MIALLPVQNIREPDKWSFVVVMAAENQEHHPSSKHCIYILVVTLEYCRVDAENQWKIIVQQVNKDKYLNGNNIFFKYTF